MNTTQTQNNTAIKVNQDKDSSLRGEAPQKHVEKEENNIEFTATYSAEDNKLRLYASERLDKDLYNRVREIGFKYAPKQELFVASRWTPAREDICIELAGEITAEETTLVERAEAKAERLDNIAVKRESQANAFYTAANRIAERFHGGQPILIGHHSERSARRDQAKMHSAMDNAVKATESIQYWNWKAEGVERHANMKGNPRVRINRIKTLLAELRDRQRDINHAFICLELWEKIKAETDQEQFTKLVTHYAGARLATGSAAPYYNGDSLYYQLEKETITPVQAVENCLNFHERQANSVFTGRWINHILNRLAFERSELGEVARFEGEITATMLQIFVREHGAHKPKAKKQGEEWVLISSVPLPLHIGDDKELVLSDSQWCDLMQASGYEVPAPKAKKPPLLNFKAGYLKGHSWGNVRTFRQIELTKAEYSEIHCDTRGVKLSECGQFRFKICQNPEQRGYDAEWCAVLLTDSKLHPAIESDSIINNTQEVA